MLYKRDSMCKESKTKMKTSKFLAIIKICFTVYVEVAWEQTTKDGNNMYHLLMWLKSDKCSVVIVILNKWDVILYLVASMYKVWEGSFTEQLQE